MTIDNELKKPIIFIGPGRSGTTIISEIIMKHPDLAYPSNYQEMFYKYPIVNYIRNLFDNKFWRIFGQKKQLNKTSIFNRYIFKPSENYQMWNYLTKEKIDFSRNFLKNTIVSEERKQLIRNYFYRMVKYQNRKRLVFKITGPSRLEYLLSIFPDAIIVHLKRKFIPTISSFLKVNFWKEKGSKILWWKGVYTDIEERWAKNNFNKPLLLTTFQLKRIEETTKEEILKLNPKYLQINYEDFVADPKQILFNTYNFLKLEISDCQLSEYLNNIQIYNRNKTDSEYFSEEELKGIHSILKN